MTRYIVWVLVGFVLAYTFLTARDLRNLSDRIERLEHTQLICRPVVGSVSDRVCVAP